MEIGIKEEKVRGEKRRKQGNKTSGIRVQN